MKKLALFLGTSAALLGACSHTSADAEDATPVSRQEFFEAFGDQVISPIEESYLSEYLASYTEDLEGVTIDSLEYVEGLESPHDRIDAEGNVYGRIYVVTIAFTIDGDKSEHGAKATLAFETNSDDTMDSTILYGSSLQKEKIYIKTEFVE